MTNVWIPSPPGGGFLEALQAGLDGVRLVEGDCDILVCGVPSRAQLSRTRSALVVPYAGVPRGTCEIMADFPALTLHNLHHNAAPVAELAVGLMLAAVKRIVPLDRALRAGDWRPRYEPACASLLDGKAAVVLGYGSIGRRIGRACEGLGMDVVGLRRGDAIRPALDEAAALFVCLPHTSETEGLLGAGELALLPQGAVLVNVARGPIVEEQALYDRLEAGTLSAGLDVWWRYPEDEQARARTPPSAHPFGGLDNVVLSPHRGGHSEQTERLRARHLATLLRAAARGEAMPNRVDLRRGY